MARFGNLPLVLVAVITVPVIVVMQVATDGGAAQAQTGGILAFLALPLPLFLSVLWGWSLMALHPRRLVPVAALVALAASGLLRPGPMVWQAMVNMAAGLAAGWALHRRLRPDAALVLCAGLLVPMVAVAIREVPVDDQLAMLRRDMSTMMETRVPASADKDQREKALALEMERVDAALKVVAKVYPLMMALGLLTQAALILGLVWFSARLTGGLTDRLRFGSFSRLRLPFYTVWLLIAGLGLLLTRAEPLLTVGLNLALLAAMVVSVQGVAVQVAVIGRMMSPLGRFLFWLVMGVFFAPLVIASGVLLGLADQWLDFRGLDRPVIDDDEKVV